jgi:1-aminocyclopropane-1-carboxylate deaminase
MSSPSPLKKIDHPLFDHHQLNVMIKRDDLIHPIISGNKWRKLKYNIEQVKVQDKKGIISFGGAYSNHIHALAFACYQQKLPCIGIIRGEHHYANNFTLRWAQHWRMQLTYVDRQTYRRRADSDYLALLQQQYPEYLIVPEGGSNSFAIPGVSEVIDELNQQTAFDSLLTPVGSGGTLAGLIAGDNNQHQLLGIAVLKQSKTSEVDPLDKKDYLTNTVSALLPEAAQQFNNWQVLPDFHRGGYAKFSQEDSQRILAFNHDTGINFEPVYSGKMLLALVDLIKQGYFAPHHRIVLLHTGGLQGLGGLSERKVINAQQWPIPPNAPKDINNNA